ncbi:uncharacterized protein [Branchiostoma lanceolatum]|uniref:uncharacterized protein n=1 Tax=Branchiostoma lanceolatum TaxID=7740 RepID=UPI003452D9CF
MAEAAELSRRARLYIKINDSLSEDDVKKLRATLITDGYLGQAKAENATPLEMFNMLEADNKIGKGNLALLVDLLKALGKRKLAQEAEDVARDEDRGGSLCAVEDVITCLKEHYTRERARVRPLPWCEDLSLPLEEVYTNLRHQRKDDKGRFQDTDTIVSLADIYITNKARAKNADAGTDVRRIRVEGDPGIGKSCSCQKLAHDWSSGKLDIFKAVFFLEIRHMSGKVKDAIFEQLLPEDTNMTPDQLWSYIQENQDDVLFILDGLDELSQVARESTDVVALIQGKILRNCHVLVTSRPYHCVKDLDKCHEFYKIVGYSKDDSVQFIQKYFSETPESVKELADQLEDDGHLSTIVVNPLNNVLICIVWEDNEGRLPSSQAELYRMIIYSVAKRFCTKKDILPEGDKFPPNIEESLRCLGKLSWEGLEQDLLQFNIDDVKDKYGTNANDMLAIGLLTRDNSFSRIKRTCLCAFLHKTFQEYMAAYYISELVKNESKRERKKGVECLRSLFGMTKTLTDNVNMKLVATKRQRYREVQNMLLSILGDSSGPLFEMFAEELGKDYCKGKYKEYLSFVCIMFLGRTCDRTGCRMAEIVAPFLSQHMNNEVCHTMTDLLEWSHVQPFSHEDHAWMVGLIQVLKCQRTLAMNHDGRLIQHLTISIDCNNMGVEYLLQQQLEATLSDCDTISRVTLFIHNQFTMDGHHFGLEFSPFSAFIPRRGTESVRINLYSTTGTNRSGYLSMENMLRELSEKRLKHVKIDIDRNEGADLSHYDSLLADMVMKQRCLRSLKVRIGHWICESTESMGFGNLTAALQSISEHSTLEVVELELPANSDVLDSGGLAPEYDRLVTFDMEAMVHKLAECVTKNKVLKRLRLSYRIVLRYRDIILLFRHYYSITYKGICDSQSLSDLCVAIQGNRTLETLTIDGMFSESEGHQQIIDQLMCNKPANFEELRITMFRSEQYAQHISTGRRSCSFDPSSDCESNNNSTIVVVRD